MSASSAVTILDVRERDDFKRQHRPGAVNIPENELSIRAYIEVDRQRPVVIDCTYTETRVCQNAANRLLRGPKIAKVFILIP
jgi:rhodanese-related sulfurtransferase